MMNAEITTKKIGSKWHGYIAERPDLDETALTEEAVRRKMEQLRDRIGTCAARTKLFGGRTCELIDGYRVLGRIAAKATVNALGTRHIFLFARRFARSRASSNVGSSISWTTTSGFGGGWV